ncbi:MAG: hypothetical protein HJJLKODD_02507 [Phycisphaerae bacterium]|nr:hypothetical protein [Phycisphaerae bacterium]
MFGCHMHIYPWDLLDEGLEAVLERLQGEAGIDGLTLVAMHDEVEQFRPHPAVLPRALHATGGVCFQPGQEHYVTTRLRPPQMEGLRKTDVVALVAEACQRRGLRLRLALTPWYSRRLVQRHPEIASKNLFGDPSRHSLCPSHADVIHYFSAVMRDLYDYESVEAVVVDHLDWPVATDPQAFDGASLLFGPEGADLLKVCFCESCLQQADAVGLDGELARRQARLLFDRLCQSTETPSFTPDYKVEQNRVLMDYLQWRADQPLRWVQRWLRDGSRPLVISAPLGLTPDWLARHLPQWLEAARFLQVPIEALETLIGELSQSTPSIQPRSFRNMELLLALDDGLVEESAEIVRQLSWAAQAGVAGAAIRHYGVALPRYWTGLHQGLRHARRQA